jgi:hypothetical protein
MSGTVLRALIACIVTMLGWRIFEAVFGHYPSGNPLVALFGRSLLSHSYLADWIMTLLVPIVFIGVSKMIWDYSEQVGCDHNDFYDDFQAGYICLIGCLIAYVFGVINMCLKFIGVHDGYVVPLIGLVTALLFFLDTRYWEGLIAYLLGFIFTILFAQGIFRGWLFPWAIIIIAASHFVILPWVFRKFFKSEYPFR